MYVPLRYSYGGSGCARALLTTSKVGALWNVPAAGNNGRWIKLGSSDPRDRVYSAGFDVNSRWYGAEYVPPPPTELVFGGGAPPLAISVNAQGANIDSASELAPYVAGGVVVLDGELQSGNVPRITEAGFALPYSMSFSRPDGMGYASMTLSDTVGAAVIRRGANFTGLYIPNLSTPASSSIQGFFLLPELPPVGGNPNTTPINSGKWWIDKSP
jgi:hypothetical protein